MPYGDQQIVIATRQKCYGRDLPLASDGGPEDPFTSNGPPDIRRAVLRSGQYAGRVAMLVGVESFGVVLIAIAVVGAVVAVLSFLRSGGVYDELGKGGLSLDEPQLRKEPAPGSAAWQAEAQMELRQLLEGKAARAHARGDEPIDVEAELARLTEVTKVEADPALRAEVREMVIASNERRARRGQPLLDVDEEIERRLRNAGAP